MSKLNVHVRGVGTIGEPLVNMLLELSGTGSLGDITFSKKSPSNLCRVKQLQRAGARFVTNNINQFPEEFNVSGSEMDAILNAHVILDCTPSGGAMGDEDFYSLVRSMPNSNLLRVISQGSENGFGLRSNPNDSAVVVDGVSVPLGDEFFVQVKSCNTHAMSTVAKLVADSLECSSVESLDFTCIRRANDIYQANGNLSTSVGSNSGEFGTHHAEDVGQVLTQEHNAWSDARFSSRAFKVNTQFMHAISFSMTLESSLDQEVALGRVLESNNPRVAFTDYTDSCQVFGFGRDYGFMGKVLNHAVIPRNSLNVQKNNDKLHVTGAILTPQDSNTLLSTIVCCLNTASNKEQTNWEGVRSSLSGIDTNRI